MNQEQLDRIRLQERIRVANDIRTAARGALSEASQPPSRLVLIAHSFALKLADAIIENKG